MPKNGTATGLDGCPYEMWTELDALYKTAKQNRKEGFDIIAALVTVFVDIQMYRLVVGSEFASGWMCPIYKKKDLTDISNYRPITLLNTDYKLLTKTLAQQLVEPNSTNTQTCPPQPSWVHTQEINSQSYLTSKHYNQLR